MYRFSFSKDLMSFVEREHRLTPFEGGAPQEAGGAAESEARASETRIEEDPAEQTQDRIRSLQERAEGVTRGMPPDEAERATEQALEETGAAPARGRSQELDHPETKPDGVEKVTEMERRAQRLNEKVRALRESIDPNVLKDNDALRCLAGMEFIVKNGKLLARFAANGYLQEIVQQFKERGHPITATQVQNFFEEEVYPGSYEKYLVAFDTITSAFGKEMPADTPPEKTFNVSLRPVPREAQELRDHPTLTGKLATLQKTMPASEKATAFGKYLQSLRVRQDANGQIILESSNAVAFRAFHRFRQKGQDEATKVRLRLTYPDITPQLTEDGGYRLTLPQTREDEMEEDIELYEMRKNSVKEKGDAGAENDPDAKPAGS